MDGMHADFNFAIAYLDDFLTKQRVKDFGSSFGEPSVDCCRGFDRACAELLCEGNINQEQSAFGARDHRGNKRRH